MKSKAVWKNNFQSIVDNGRNHSVLIDWPKVSMGDDEGPTPLELSVMGLSGCISTIFVAVARKRKVQFTKLEVELETAKAEGAKIMTNVDCIVSVQSGEPIEKLKTCLDITLSTCPVSILFEQAGVKITHKLHLL